MRNIFNTRAFFCFITVFFCGMFVFGQFSIETLAAEPSQVSAEYNSGGEVVRDGTADKGSTSFIGGPAFEEYNEFFESIYELIPSYSERAPLVSANSKPMSEQATNKTSDNSPPGGIKEFRNETIDQFGHSEPLACAIWLFIYDSSFLLGVTMLIYITLKAIWLRIKWTFF